jgi:non-ribosomal peptide synthetase component F
MTSQSRVGHFSAYSFDASIIDTVLALTQGASIYVISEEDRLNCLANAMARIKVTWCFLTPTVIQMLEPEQVSALQTIISRGKRLPNNLVRK